MTLIPVTQKQARILLDILDLSFTAKGKMEDYPLEMKNIVNTLMLLDPKYKPLQGRYNWGNILKLINDESL